MMSRLWILLLLAVPLFLGSCSFFGNSELSDEQIVELGVQERDVVMATIADEEREQLFLALLSEREDLLERYRLMLQAHAASIRALNADYRSERDEYSAIFADYNRERVAVQREFVRVVERMKALATAQEWAVIADHQLKYMDARRLTFRRAFRGA